MYVYIMADVSIYCQADRDFIIFNVGVASGARGSMALDE